MTAQGSIVLVLGEIWWMVWGCHNPRPSTELEYPKLVWTLFLWLCVYWIKMWTWTQTKKQHIKHNKQRTINSLHIIWYVASQYKFLWLLLFKVYMVNNFTWSKKLWTVTLSAMRKHCERKRRTMGLGQECEILLNSNKGCNWNRSVNV